MRIKIYILFFLFIASSITINSIGKESYKKLTDRDRILLSVSYYEVAEKYKELGNEELYNAYISEALKIEKNVKKYIIGELELPEKKININFDNIFPEENTNMDNTSDGIENNDNPRDIDKKINLNNSPSDMIKSIVTSIIDSDFNTAVSFFSEEIWLSQYKYMLTNIQLLEFFKEWKQENKNIKKSDEIIESIGYLNDEQYKNSIFIIEDVSYIALQFKLNPIFPGNSYSNNYIIICQEFKNPHEYKIVGMDQI